MPATMPCWPLRGGEIPRTNGPTLVPKRSAGIWLNQIPADLRVLHVDAGMQGRCPARRCVRSPSPMRQGHFSAMSEERFSSLLYRRPVVRLRDIGIYPVDASFNERGSFGGSSKARRCPRENLPGAPCLSRCLATEWVSSCADRDERWRTKSGPRPRASRRAGRGRAGHRQPSAGRGW